MSYAILKNLQEKRNKLTAEMTAMLEGNPDGFSEEQSTRFDEISTQVGTYAQDVESCSGLGLEARRIQLAEEQLSVRVENEETQRRDEFRANPKTAEGPSYEERQEGYRLWGLVGSDYSLSDGEIEHVQRCGMDPNSGGFTAQLYRQAPKSIAEIREMAKDIQTRATTTAQTITTTGGGHTIGDDQSFISQIEIGLKAHGGARDLCRVIRTATGATMPIATVDDTTNKSVVLAINTDADVEALVFGQFTLAAHKYTTRSVLVPIELMQDSAINLPATIGELLGVRAARGTNEHFTVGVSSDTQPNGYVTASAVGSTGSDVNTVTYAELVTLEHSVDPAYRRSPSAAWGFEDNTLQVIKKLTDGNSLPLWTPGLMVSGEPDRLLGYRYVINQDHASIASATTGAGGAKAVTFGDMSKHLIRDVLDFQVLRLNERFATLGQVAFLAFHRHDSNTIVGSTAQAPIKHFITKST